jgi:hypothetical protein
MRGYLFVRQTLCNKTENRALPWRKTDCRRRSGDVFREQRSSWDDIALQAIQKRSTSEPARQLNRLTSFLFGFTRSCIVAG